MTQQINLIDKTAQIGRDLLSALNVAVALGVAVLALVGHYSVEQWQWQRVSAASAQAESAQQASSEAAQQMGEQLAKLQAQIAADDRLRQAEQALLDPPQACEERLKAMVAVLPSSLWLREVEFVGQRQVRIAGSSLRSADVAALAQSLGSLEAFGGLPVRVLSLVRREVKPEIGNGGDDAGEQRTPAWAAFDFELSSIDAQSAEGASGESSGGAR